MQNYIGKQIDRYRILARLGLGGMAVVYRAYDVRLERDVAIKLIRTEEIPPSQHQRLLQRFEREAKSQAGFHHPNIVPAYDYGEENGVPYLVLAYMAGGTLKQRIQGPLSLGFAFNVIVPIADAVAYAHSKGVLHRDIKPSNIIFDQDDKPMLTDFGIAKVLETSEGTLTGTGLGVGTPEYMAPEQWQGKADPASDQYALGVLLYEMLTGHKPYTAETPLAVALKQLNDPLTRPSDLVKNIPFSVEAILFKALAKQPEDRFEDVLSFRDRVIAVGQDLALFSEFSVVVQAGEDFAKSSEEEALKEASAEDAPEESQGEVAEPPPGILAALDSEGGEDETRDILDAPEGSGAALAVESEAGMQAEAREPSPPQAPAERRKPKPAPVGLAKLFRSMTFWLIVVGVVLLAGGWVVVDIFRNNWDVIFAQPPEAAVTETVAGEDPEKDHTKAADLVSDFTDTPAAEEEAEPNRTSTPTRTPSPTATVLLTHTPTQTVTHTPSATPTETVYYEPPTATAEYVAPTAAPQPTSAPQPTAAPTQPPQPTSPPPTSTPVTRPPTPTPP